jgi:hypothetical protein
MNDRIDDTVPPKAAALLRDWLSRSLAPGALAWLDDACAEVATGAPERGFFLSYGTAVHRCGKAGLELTAHDLEEAEALRPGWHPSDWSREQAARALLVLALPVLDEHGYDGTLMRLQETADVGEAAALCRALPILPNPRIHRRRAELGLRSNMTGVFEAVACRNPYPADWLEEPAWNQMVLKAIFVGSRLHRITGLDRRANPALSRMLADYAHERWSAGRPVDPELWRVVGPHADSEAVADLGRVLREGDEREKRAAALALWACPAEGAAELLMEAPELEQAARDGNLTWTDVERSDDQS